MIKDVAANSWVALNGAYNANYEGKRQ